MMPRLRPLVLLIPPALALLIGCARNASQTDPPASAASAAKPASAKGGDSLSGELRLFVPCGVAGPYGELTKVFSARHPHVKITQEMANIDVQTKEVLDGKGTPDVWISLGDIEVNRVKKAGLIDGKPVTYAYNSIAFMVARNNPCNIESVDSLTSDKVKTIALPNEDNSSGYYARKVFEKSGVWEKLQGKLWLTPEPSAVKIELSSGHADVGVVYYPCTRETRLVGGHPEEMKGKVQLLGKIPTELSGPIPAQAAVIKGCANPKLGHAFLEFLLEDEVQDIWENWAFDRAKQPASGPRTNLYMYCGAGIRPIMDKVVDAFKVKMKNVRIDVGYAGSGCLLSQLTFARRGDLYMPGETFYLDQAKKKGYVTSEKLTGFFDPVILVQKGNPKQVRGLADLAKPGLKVGLGEPDACAAGVAAKKLLADARLTSQVEKNVTVRANNVPELGNYVKLKSLDAAIVWNLTAVQVAADCDAVALPPGSYQPSPIPVALLKFSQHPAEAKAFIDFLTGLEGQKLIKDGGMTPAGAGGAATAGAAAK